MDDEEIQEPTENGDEETVRQVAERLRLEAIELGERSQAFMNDKLLSVGDEITVTVGSDTVVCKVTGIEENTVFVRYGETEITLELIQGH